MAPKNSSRTASATDREIVNARVFAFSRERVFQAFSDPKQLAQWWGPNGFTNTIQEFDLRPGGIWRLVMHGPNGADYHNKSRFMEVVIPERVVFDHLEPVHRFQMTMIFTAQGNQTHLEWRMLFESAEHCAQIRNFIIAANEENFDRLAAHLAKTT